MKPRRRMRTPPHGFFLNLGDGSPGEVQVQQKNEYEVNKFLINGDDAILSPIVTMDLSQTHDPGTFRSSLSITGVNTTAPVDSLKNTNQTHPANDNAVGASVNNGLGNTATPGSTINSTGSNIGVGPAKFIHVNNTNLFVLIDGISMFFEGKSTFTGDEDPLLRQQILNKMSVKALSTSKSADAVESTTSEMIPARGGGDGGGGGGERSLDVKSRPHNQRASSFSTDAVENAIRYIQQEVSNIHPTTPHEAVAPGAKSASTEHLSKPSSISSPHSVPFAAKKGPSKEFLSFFSGALKPCGVPLFGYGLATAWRRPPKEPPGCSQSPPSDAPSVGSSATASNRPFFRATPSAKGGASTPVLPPAKTESRLSTSQPHPREPGGRIGLKGKLSFPPSRVEGVESAGLRGRGGRGAASWRSSAGNSSKSKVFSAEDVGHSNHSLDLDDVEVLHFIDGGSQGKVYCVRLEGKLYALKCIDVKAAMQATNAVERQGRKRGLVKELNMIRLQQSTPPATHLMRMFNAVASLNGQQQLSILLELMSFGVDKMQQMVARIPHRELMKLVQSTFKSYMAKHAPEEGGLARGLKRQLGPPSQVLGRRDFNTPKAWERAAERQTAVPEIILAMIAADTLAGLRALHTDYRIVHCDIKPENILLSFDKQSFKISDFGCGCAIDARTGKVRCSGVDLGAKLYRAPERLIGKDPASLGVEAAPEEEEEDGRIVDSPFAHQVIEFDEKADVWSLGVTLLELACGVHPCSPFKSDFWNYTNELKLTKMVKPLTWSPDFCDFIVRCVCVDVAKRWSVDQLLEHPFILHYSNVPRSRLRIFMERLEEESASFQRKQQRELLQKQILLSTNQVARDNYLKESRSKWKEFTGFLSVTPELKDLSKFPRLA
ncbi:unnamed protein product [Phytomonas sp. EM1]|nr:unnamed protein product [Phytomonas sp. EM1]|eukprot:CCW62768.1 unnamed protein product [Phytomonas sp. isolate EM1]